jgi:3-keto-5-aminohexanoate cleavage enzyme
MDPLIINAAITGMLPMKSDTPHVPITPEEINADVRRCRNAGASIIHLHAREPDGAPTYRKEIFADALHSIREEHPDLLISGSTSGRMYKEFWQRSEVLDLQPDFGSLTLGSMNFAKQASVNDPAMIRQLADAMNQRGIMPELELFDLGMAEFAQHLIRKEILWPPYYANILLGSLGTLSATPDNLCAVVRALPPGTIWSATGIGRFQFFINSLAVTFGGHVRVGLEDAIYYDWTDKQLATNAGLIDRVVNLAYACGREIASPAVTREILGVPATQPSVTRAA